MASLYRRHPSQRGLVMLAGWVSPGVRNHAKQSAAVEEVPLSKWLARAVETQASVDAMQRSAARRASSAKRGGDK